MTDRCPRCRRSVPGEAAFCPACGAAVAGDEVLIELEGAPQGAGAEVTFEPVGRRGRWVGAGVVAALVVAVGASIASGGGDERTAATTTTAERPASTTSSTATTGPTTAAATTTAAPRVRGPGEGPLLGEPTGLVLLVATADGVHRLDLDARTFTSADTRDIRSGVEDLQAIRDGYLFWSNGELWAATDGGEARRLGEQLQLGGQLVGEDVDGAAVLVIYGNGQTAAAPYVARIRAADGEPERVMVPWAPDTFPNVRPDGIGGFAMGVAGGVFRWVPGDEIRPVAPGALVDVAGRFVLTRTCYPEPSCRLLVTDLVDGDVRSLADPGAGAGESMRVSPDGRWVLTDLARLSFTPGTPEVSPSMRAWNVDDGSVVVLDLPADSPVGFNGWMRSVVEWSPDGRWLFYAADSHTLRAWRTGSDAPIDIDLPDRQLMGAVSLVPA